MPFVPLNLELLIAGDGLHLLVGLGDGALDQGNVFLVDHFPDWVVELVKIEGNLLVLSVDR